MAMPRGLIRVQVQHVSSWPAQQQRPTRPGRTRLPRPLLAKPRPLCLALPPHSAASSCMRRPSLAAPPSRAAPERMSPCAAPSCSRTYLRPYREPRASRAARVPTRRRADPSCFIASYSLAVLSHRNLLFQIKFRINLINDHLS